jgi:hypothetical protein
VEARDAKGSGVRAGCERGWEKPDARGDVIWGVVGFEPDENRSVMDCVDGLGWAGG